MKKCVLILANHVVTILSFRLELVERLLAEGHRVVVSIPSGEHIKTLTEMGCECIPTDFDRHGVNPVKDLRLFFLYHRMIGRVRPDMVFTYTIKPNVYGGMAAHLRRVPCVANVTGLGGALLSDGWKQKIALLLYRLGLRHDRKVYFQNEFNRDFMLSRGVRGKENELLPGSGVNLARHCVEEYPAEEEGLRFVIIGRLMRDKGTGEILTAARNIKRDFPSVTFRFVGFYDDGYAQAVTDAVREGLVEHVGHVEDVHAQIRDSHATIHASYHEGMANALLESAACARPVIATDIPGCREIVEEGVNGLLCEVKNAESLEAAIRRFLALPRQTRIEMGLCGRAKIEREFDRNIVVEQYMAELADV